MSILKPATSLANSDGKETILVILDGPIYITGKQYKVYFL